MPLPALPEPIEWNVNLAYDRINEDEKKKGNEQEQEETPAKGGSLPELAQKLRSTKKFSLFKGNSDEYKSVNNALSAILAAYNRPLTRDPEKDINLISVMIENYVVLLQACDNYVNRKNIGKGPFGAARLGIVLQVRNRAAEDKAGFLSYGDRIRLIREEDRASTMSEVLGNARIRKLNLKGSEADQKHVGGAVSHVTVISSGDLKGDDSTGFFKAEETFTMDKGKNVLVGMVGKLRQQIPLTDQKFEPIQTFIDEIKEDATAGAIFSSSNALESNPLYVTDQQFHEFVNLLRKQLQAWDTANCNINKNLNLNLKDNESVNLSKRNVATSRIATLLGVGNLVASSETAELIDDGKETGTRGNFMQKAKGSSASELYTDILQNEQVQREEEGKGDTEFHQYRGITKKATPEFQKSLSGLQVLDHLTGQVDRHMKNYMVDVDEGGKLGAVQGIDNDFAFGIGYNTTGHGRSILDADGALSIPHMDKGLADRILQLDEKQARYALSDVLEPRAIDAFVERLASIKKALADVKNKDDPNGQLLAENQWNENTLEDFRECNVFGRSPTYLGEVLKQEKNLNNSVDKKRKKDLDMQIGGRYLDQMIKQAQESGMLETPEQCFDFFSNYAPTNRSQKILKFMMNQGTLTADISNLDPAVYEMMCAYARLEYDNKGNTEKKE